MRRKRRHQHILDRALQALQDGRPEDAERLLQRLLKDRPRDHAVHHHLGMVLWQQGDLDTGLERLELAASMAATEGLYQANLGRLYAQLGDLRAACAALHRAVVFEPDNAAWWAWHGQVLHRAGRAVEARHALAQSDALSARDAADRPALEVPQNTTVPRFPDTY